MIKMIYRETTIKVRPSKVDQMLRKGWGLADETQEVIAEEKVVEEAEIVDEIDDLDDITEDSEEE